MSGARDEHRNATLAAGRELDNLSIQLIELRGRARQAAAAVDSVATGADGAGARAISRAYEAVESIETSIEYVAAAVQEIEEYGARL